MFPVVACDLPATDCKQFLEGCGHKIGGRVAALKASPRASAPAFEEEEEGGGRWHEPERRAAASGAVGMASGPAFEEEDLVPGAVSWPPGPANKTMNTVGKEVGHRHVDLVPAIITSEDGIRRTQDLCAECWTDA